MGIGSISSFWCSLAESILLTIFVLPELHGQRIGSYIITDKDNHSFYANAYHKISTYADWGK